MFNFFKKKAAPVMDNRLFAPATGELIAIDQVEDVVFSKKMMGDGYAVVPTSGEIYSPVRGTVSSIFPTKHAMGLTTAEGVEVLIHMGLDTVELKGTPFETMVSEGQAVTETTLLSRMNLEAIKEAGKGITTMVVFTNMDKVKGFSVDKGSVEAGQEVGQLEVVK